MTEVVDSQLHISCSGSQDWWHLSVHTTDVQNSLCIVG